MLERFILSSQSSSSPPQPPQPAEDSKSVCIIADMFPKKTTYSFKFDPDQDQLSSLSIDNCVGGGELTNHRILSPNSGTCKIDMYGEIFYAAIGSTMYWFGGNNVEIDQSTNFPESGWKHGPTMIAPYRRWDCHNKTVIDGKLYVFGGGFNEPGEPWGECFDPIKNRWEALPDPPVPLEESITSVFDKKILVGVRMSGEFYGYDLMTNSWSLLSSLSNIIIKPEFFGKVVRVNNTLYFFDEPRLVLDAYDLDKRMWFVGYFEHLKLDGLVVDPHCFRVCFFHLGGGGGGDGENLCVLWDSNRLDSESGLKCINFIKFRVTKRIIDHVEEV